MRVLTPPKAGRAVGQVPLGRPCAHAWFLTVKAGRDGLTGFIAVHIPLVRRRGRKVPGTRPPPVLQGVVVYRGVDELTLFARAAGCGDRAALARLIRATQADVWRLCAHLADPSNADDLAQETYVRAIPALRGFRGDAPVRAWLLTIARRVCVGEIRTRQRDRKLSASLGAVPATQESPDGSLLTELSMLIAELDPDRRAAFVLTQLLGCSYAEAAAICGCPPGTIRSRVARARADLITMTTESASVSKPARPRAGGH
jgi:RNA polymerase sigma-70 factor (ECF subfamily)